MSYHAMNCFETDEPRLVPMAEMQAFSNRAVNVEKQSEEASLTRGDILLSAHKTINGKRQDCYGNPEDSFQIIANLWDGYITTKMEKAGVQPVITSFIQAFDVMLLMALMKVARIQNNPKDKDSYRDALGYLALACDFMTAEDLEKD